MSYQNLQKANVGISYLIFAKLLYQDKINCLFLVFFLFWCDITKLFYFFAQADKGILLSSELFSFVLFFFFALL